VLLFNRSALPANRAAAPTPTATTPAAKALPGITAPAPPAPDAATSANCTELISALPVQLGKLDSRPVFSNSAAVVAWGDPPVVLRCGVAEPAGYRNDSELQTIDGVDFYVAQTPATTVWTTVDRPVYVEISVPTNYAGAPVARLVTAITASLKERPLTPPS
jgi:Protein of unknown function (DUF3515)